MTVIQAHGVPRQAVPKYRRWQTPSPSFLADMLEQEQSQMMAMPAPFDGYVEKAARVSSTCLVSVDRNRYSVLCRLRHNTDYADVLIMPTSACNVVCQAATAAMGAA